MPKWNAEIKQQDPESGLEKRPVIPGQNPMQSEGKRSSVISTKNVRDAIESARELIKANRFDDALKVYEEILEKNPDIAPAYVGIGNIHLRRGEYDEALEYYAGALHIRKDLPEALVMSGNVYIQQGFFDKALEKYKEALEVNPGLGHVYLNVSRTYARQGKFKEAIDSIAEALKQNPQLEDARLELAKIHQEMGNFDEALKEVINVITKNPDSWRAQFQYARLLIMHGEFKQAISACKKVIDAKPDNAIMHHMLGRSYMGAREYELALREYVKAIEIDPLLHIANISIAKVNIERGNLADAKKLLIKMSKGVKHLGLVHRLLGDILIKEGLYSDAIAEFQAAILHSKRLVEMYPDLMAVQSVTGNDDRKIAEAYQEAFAKIDLDYNNQF